MTKPKTAAVTPAMREIMERRRRQASRFVMRAGQHWFRLGPFPLDEIQMYDENELELLDEFLEWTREQVLRAQAQLAAQGGSDA